MAIRNIMYTGTDGKSLGCSTLKGSHSAIDASMMAGWFQQPMSITSTMCPMVGHSYQAVKAWRACATHAIRGIPTGKAVEKHLKYSLIYTWDGGC
jgi:hypothetical protein